MINEFEKEFLQQSNWIEEEYSEIALEDAIKAWEYNINHIKEKEKIKVSDILEIHRILMHRINPRIAGSFRDCDVWIGGKRKKFIGKETLESEVEKWLDKYNYLTAGNSQKSHIQFEGIHPFEDGNGRVGRILYNLHRLREELPIDVIKADEKYSYYKWFD